MNRLIHLFIYAADIQSGHHDATQSTSSADSADWSRGGAAVVSGSGDVVVPYTLVTEEELADAIVKYPPKWEAGQFTDGTPNTPADRVTKPFTLRRLSNGMRIGVARNAAESQRGHLRLVAPGGRDAEQRYGFRPGSLAVGARAMQEGGSFGKFTREQV